MQPAVDDIERDPALAPAVATRVRGWGSLAPTTLTQVPLTHPRPHTWYSTNE